MFVWINVLHIKHSWWFNEGLCAFLNSNLFCACEYMFSSFQMCVVFKELGFLSACVNVCFCSSEAKIQSFCCFLSFFSLGHAAWSPNLWFFRSPHTKSLSHFLLNNSSDANTLWSNQLITIKEFPSDSEETQLLYYSLKWIARMSFRLSSNKTELLSWEILCKSHIPDAQL